MWSKLLDRQLRRSKIDLETLPPEMKSLLASVNAAYEHYEQDRTLLERALDLSSKELSDMNSQLKEINAIAEQRHQEIMSSLTYAKMIQEAIFPDQLFLSQHFQSYFVLNFPKQIVSGDFYWLSELEGNVYLALADCTGHGVPGAFMSLIGFNLLNSALHEHHITKPSQILDHLDQEINTVLKQKFGESSVREGMDIAICCIDKQKSKIQFSGAFNSLFLLQEKNLVEIKGTKARIGYSYIPGAKVFTNNEISYNKGDTIYLCTDGFSDQFGGPEGKKFKTNRLKALFAEISDLTSGEQKKALESAFIDWKGDFSQIDDALVFGARL